MTLGDRLRANAALLEHGLCTGKIRAPQLRALVADLFADAACADRLAEAAVLLATLANEPPDMKTAPLERSRFRSPRENTTMPVSRVRTRARAVNEERAA